MGPSVEGEQAEGLVEAGRALGAHTGRGGGVKPRSQSSALKHRTGHMPLFSVLCTQDPGVLAGTAKELAVTVRHQWLPGVWTPLLSPPGLRLRC